MAHPGFIKPQLATLYPSIPQGRWLYEVKFDGYRMQIQKDRKKAHFYTRNGLDWLSKFPFINASNSSPTTSSLTAK